MKKIKSTQTPRPGRKPAMILAATVAVMALLCGAGFAAYELFDFSELFGPQASLIEDAVTTYSPEPEQVVSASGGHAEVIKASAEDYNFVLRGDVQVSPNLIYTFFDVSRVNEDVPKFEDSGLTLGIEGYETKTFVRGANEMFARVVVYAPLDTPLEAETLNFTLTDGSTSTVLLSDTPVVRLEANAAVFDAPDPSADYVLDSAALTEDGITVSGHFQKEFADYAAALDASGTLAPGEYPWPLLDRFMDEFDPEDGQEHQDLEGYLIRRDVDDDGSFTLEWTYVKGGFLTYGTLTFGGVEYEIPEPEMPEIEPEKYVPTYATAAETQDYRFTLESVVASPSAIYAIVDMEPLTECGAAHMDQTLSVICSDLTNWGNGMVSSILLESGPERNRYLSYVLCEESQTHQIGDVLSFEVWDLSEDGDTATHNYHLFDAELESLVTASATAEYISGEPTGIARYTEVTVTPLSIHLTGTYDNGSDPKEPFQTPEVILNFKDGSSHTILDESWRPSENLSDFGTYGAVSISSSADGNEYSGTVYHSILLSQLVSLEDLDTVTIDGAVYQVNYEIG